MKKCKYCGQITETENTKCKGCGSTQFIIVCENCGNEFEDGLYCPRCGIRSGQKEKICPQCGNRYFTNACSNCGYMENNRTSFQQPVYIEPVVIQSTIRYPEQEEGKPKSKLVAWLLCFFLGFFGVHKFYEGNTKMGLVYLFTLGLFGFGWLIDLVVLLTKPSVYYPHKH